MSAVGYETVTGSLTKTAVDEVVAVNLQEAQVVPTFSVVPAEAIIVVNGNVWVAGSNYPINKEFEYSISLTGYEDITDSIILTEENKDIEVNLVKIMITPIFTVADEDGPILDYDVTIDGEPVGSYEYGSEVTYTVTSAGYENYTDTITLTTANSNISVVMTAE